MMNTSHDELTGPSGLQQEVQEDPRSKLRAAQRGIFAALPSLSSPTTSSSTAAAEAEDESARSGAPVKKLRKKKAE